MTLLQIEAPIVNHSGLDRVYKVFIYPLCTYLHTCLPYNEPPTLTAVQKYFSLCTYLIRR